MLKRTEEAEAEIVAAAKKSAESFVAEFPGQTPVGDWDTQAFQIDGEGRNWPGAAWKFWSDTFRAEVERLNAAIQGAAIEPNLAKADRDWSSISEITTQTWARVARADGAEGVRSVRWINNRPELYGPVLRHAPQYASGPNPLDE